MVKVMACVNTDDSKLSHYIKTYMLAEAVAQGLHASMLHIWGRGLGDLTLGCNDDIVVSYFCSMF